jgi:3-oxoacyl-[acyl-carrier protein] reductase
MESILRLEGKVCFVTGSTRGIGWSTAKLLAQSGATVLLNGKSDEAALATRVDELRSATGNQKHAALFGDVSDPVTVREFYQRIFKEHQRLDVLVNNAGVLQGGVLGMLTPAFIDDMLRTNTHSVLLNMQEAARLMMRHKSGSIINLTSILGTNGAEGQTVYAASKAAVIGATKAAAKELAPRNIRVNAVAPGFIDTDMTRQLAPEKFDQEQKRIKMGRAGTADDVARVILFLACDLSSYVTGQVVGVDGGMLI